MARATNDFAAVRQLAGPMIMYSCKPFLSWCRFYADVSHQLVVDASVICNDAAGLVDSKVLWSTSSHSL
jgi:hypothetical protein